MDVILNYGIAKTQKLPYLHWNQLRVIESKQDLVQFFRQDLAFFQDFLSKRTSESKVQEIFKEGEIRDNSEFDYLCESTKSAIFRAGGSNIIDWGIWHSGSNGMDGTKLSESKAETINVYGSQVELPLGYSITLPKQLYNDMCEATRKIHAEIRKQTHGPKILSRVDFVVINEKKAYIVDVGESNTTLGLADALYGFSGLGNGKLLEEYIDRIINEQQTLVPNFNRLVLIAEDQNMVHNLGYEFQAMQSLLKHKYNIPSETLIMDELPELSGNKTALVRCFRGIRTMPNLKSGMVDDLSALDVYSKENLFEIIERLQNEFPQSIDVPIHRLFRLGELGEGDLSSEIFQEAKNEGLEDFVVKPSIKSRKSSSLAYLYSTDNHIHPRQLAKTLRKLNNEGHIPYVILEENVGSGIIDGKKLEVRLHCLSN